MSFRASCVCIPGSWSLIFDLRIDILLFPLRWELHFSATAGFIRISWTDGNSVLPALPQLWSVPHPREASLGEGFSPATRPAQSRSRMGFGSWRMLSTQRGRIYCYLIAIPLSCCWRSGTSWYPLAPLFKGQIGQPRFLVALSDNKQERENKWSLLVHKAANHTGRQLTPGF